MDSDIKKMMEFSKENNRFSAAKKYSDAEVKKFVEEGGMNKYEKVNGEYREKSDIDGSKLKKQQKSSKIFLISFIAILLIAAVMLAIETVG